MSYSVNHGDLWNQRRAVLCHFNSAASPMYLHVRFLKEGYDFASAYLASQQRDGTVAGAVTLVSDGGDTHINNNKVGARATIGRQEKLLL
jgi:hypothetical protein